MLTTFPEFSKYLLASLDKYYVLRQKHIVRVNDRDVKYVAMADNPDPYDIRAVTIYYVDGGTDKCGPGAIMNWKLFKLVEVEQE